MTQLQPATVETTLTKNLQPRELLVTQCCGARLWRDLNPRACPMCGKEITAIVRRPPEHVPALGGKVTRYWS